MTTLDRVIALLDRHSIPYALIGAAALAAYGVARSTFDVDLLVTDPRVLDASLWQGVAADVRRGDADDPLRGVVRVTADDDQPVDVVVGKLSWQEHAVQRARRTGGDVPIVQLRDLVLLKLYAGGTQDLWDVRELMKVSNPSLKDDVSVDVQNMTPQIQRVWTNLQSEI